MNILAHDSEHTLVRENSRSESAESEQIQAGFLQRQPETRSRGQTPPQAAPQTPRSQGPKVCGNRRPASPAAVSPSGMCSPRVSASPLGNSCTISKFFMNTGECSTKLTSMCTEKPKHSRDSLSCGGVSIPNTGLLPKRPPQSWTDTHPTRNGKWVQLHAGRQDLVQAKVAETFWFSFKPPITSGVKCSFRVLMAICIPSLNGWFFSMGMFVFSHWLGVALCLMDFSPLSGSCHSFA